MGLDPALLPYLTAADRAAEDRALEALVQEVEPVARRIVRQKVLLFAQTGGGFSSRESELAEDTCSLVVLRVLEKADTLKQRLADLVPDPAVRRRPETYASLSPEALADLREDAIRSVRGLAARVTRNLVNELLRIKYPLRHKLRNRVLYQLTKDSRVPGEGPRYAVWDEGGERIAGRADWAGSRVEQGARRERLLADPREFEREVLRAGGGAGGTGLPSAAELSRCVEAVFDWVGGPLYVDDLVAVAAHVFQVRDQTELELDHLRGAPGEDEETLDLPDRGPTAEDQVLAGEQQRMMRVYLQRVWEEICRLSPPECVALLLRLVDHEDHCVIHFLPGLGIAALPEIAAAMGMEPRRLAELWSRLPLEDRQIGELLGYTASRVAVTRFRARRKLERRAGVSG